jgi:ferredoxin-NADP reductase
MTTIVHPPHIEAVTHKTTSVTLISSEFEADVRVDNKHEAADGVVTLILREVDNHPLPPWSPGAHVDLILGEAPTRQYSLCGDPADHHAWRLGILRDPGGHGSSLYVHDQLQTGDTIRIRGPRNNFALAESPRYLFLAGGIGITPILSMIAAAEAAGASWQLVYGGRQRASMAFLDELASTATGWRSARRTRPGCWTWIPWSARPRKTPWSIAAVRSRCSPPSNNAALRGRPAPCMSNGSPPDR